MGNEKRMIDMKRQSAVRFLFVLMVIVVWIVVLQAYGQEKPKETAGFTIARLVVGTGVEKADPVGGCGRDISSVNRKGLLLLRGN
jgi:hypothetical protein